MFCDHKKIYKIIFIWFSFFLALSFSTNACYKIVEIGKNTDLIEEKKLFCEAFSSLYGQFKPQLIESHFRDKKTVDEWIEATFDTEKEYFDTHQHAYGFVLKTNSNQPVTVGLVFFETIDDFIHIRQFCVKPNYQRKGIGKLMLEILKAKFSNYKMIILDTRRINQPARSFYKKQGFSENEKPYDSNLNSSKYINLSMTS